MSLSGEGKALRERIAEKTIQRLRRFTEHLESGQPVGEVYSCKKIVLDVQIRQYDAAMVKEVRKLLNVSQSLFAAFLNVSPSTVQKWERGRTPDGAACRLLDEIQRDPEYWKRRFHAMARKISS